LTAYGLSFDVTREGLKHPNGEWRTTWPGAMPISITARTPDGVCAGAVGVADHVTIGDDAIAMAMSGIGGNVAPRTIVGGFPAAPREKMMETLLNIGRLKQFFKKIDSLTAKVDELEKTGKKA